MCIVYASRMIPKANSCMHELTSFARTSAFPMFYRIFHIYLNLTNYTMHSSKFKVLIFLMY